MPILINFNICDNSPECSGLVVCDFGAIYWDENELNALGQKGTLCCDNTKCVACRKCVGDEGCPVGAIVFSDSEDELESKKREAIIDPNIVGSLFVERYGAEPIDKDNVISMDELQTLLLNNKGTMIVEEFADSSIQCLISSIPAETIINQVCSILRVNNVKYYKCDVSESDDYALNLPVLKIYSQEELVAQVDGYYNDEQKTDLIEVLRSKLH